MNWKELMWRIIQFPYWPNPKNDSNFWPKTWIMICIAAFFAGYMVAGAIYSAKVGDQVQIALDEFMIKYSAEKYGNVTNQFAEAIAQLNAKMNTSYTVLDTSNLSEDT